jgi:hypothetical protein
MMLMTTSGFVEVYEKNLWDSNAVRASASKNLAEMG